MTPRLPQVAEIPAALYVKRSADHVLTVVIREMGRPPYILDPRQMGKTNLLLNTRRELENDQLRFVYLDLSFRPDTLGLFYRRLVETAALAHPDVFTLASVARCLDGMAAATGDLDIASRFEELLREILRTWFGRLVIVLDEIDALTAKSFSDRIFAQIRSFYFIRKDNPEFARLTYVLSGVAEPTQLIKDKSISPFNIGFKIVLDDFGREEVRSLLVKAGLGFDDATVDRLIHWTGGNPRLTYDLASALDLRELAGEAIDAAAVDQTVERLYLTSFDRAPVDHIRALVEDDPELRRALTRFRAGEAISARERTALHLAGALSMEPESRQPSFRSRIVDASLSQSWLDELAGSTIDLLATGRAAYDARELTAAVDSYERYFAREPVTAIVAPDLLRLANAYRTIGDAERSLHWYGRFMDLRGRAEASVLLRTGALRRTLGRDDEAERDFRAALGAEATGPQRLAVMAELAELLADRGEEAEARALAESILAARDGGDGQPDGEDSAARASAFGTLAQIAGTGAERLELLHEAARAATGAQRVGMLTRLAEADVDGLDDGVGAQLERAIADLPPEEGQTPNVVAAALLALRRMGGRDRFAATLRNASAHLGMAEDELLATTWRLSAGSGTEITAELARDIAGDLGEALLQDERRRRLLAWAVVEAAGDVHNDVASAYLALLGTCPGQVEIEDHYAVMLLLRSPPKASRAVHAEALFEAVRNISLPADARARQTFALVKYVQTFGAIRYGRHAEARAHAQEAMLLLEEVRNSPDPKLPPEVVDGIHSALRGVAELPLPRPPERARHRHGRNEFVTVVYRDGETRTAKYKHVRQDLDLGACRLAGGAKPA